MRERAMVIVNPRSGRGKGRTAASRIERVAAKLDWPVEIRQTEGPGHERELGQRAVRDGWKVVIAAGGDGTAHNVANGLLEVGASRLPVFGVVPLGTGNDFARETGIPLRSVGASLTALYYGSETEFDVGRVFGEYFINGFGLGFSAAVVRAAEKYRYLSGLRLYLAATLHSFFGFKPRPMSIKTPQHNDMGKILLVEVSIGKTAGGGFRLTPDADPDDGLFDVCIIEAIKASTFLRYLPAAVTGRHTGLPPVTIRRTARLLLECGEESPTVHLDGELRTVPGPNLEIEIEPRALRVICGP